MIGLVLLIWFGFGKTAEAALWDLTGSLGQELRYDDNIGLFLGKDPVWGYLLTPTLQAKRKTDTLEIAFRGQGDIRRYDSERWDCDNYNLGLDNRYAATALSVFQLRGDFARACTQTQQITDTGILVPNAQSTRYGVAPSWSWQWTPRDQLSVDTSYSKTSYTSGTLPGSSGFSGNETYTATVGENRVWDPRLTLKGNLFFSNVKFTGATASHANLFGFQMGGNYLISEKWKAEVEGGPRWSESRPSSAGASSPRGSSVVTGYFANASVNYNGEVTDFSIKASHTINPSAIGQLVQYDNVDINWSYPFTQRLSLDLGGNFQRSESLANQNAFGQNTFERTYYSAVANVVWQIARNWDIKLGYRYRWQRFKGDEHARDSNAAMLSLNYDWEGLQYSR